MCHRVTYLVGFDTHGRPFYEEFSSDITPCSKDTAQSFLQKLPDPIAPDFILRITGIPFHHVSIESHISAAEIFELRDLPCEGCFNFKVNGQQLVVKRSLHKQELEYFLFRQIPRTLAISTEQNRPLVASATA